MTAIPDDMTELVNANIDRVDLVGSAANGTRFLIAKGAGLVDAATVRDLIAKAGDAPDDDTVPGSPAWEAVDAAAAQQWVGVLVRAKNALAALSDRETAEGGDDWCAAMNLADAADSIGYAVRVLAEFAANEAYEADPPDDVLAVAKSVDPDSLATIENIVPLIKAGRSLSAANEKALRDAAEKIQNVLNSLPTPPEDTPLLKETAAMAEENTTPEATAADVTKTAEDATPETVEKTGSVEDITKEGTLTAVYDQSGNLIGVVDPSALTAVDSGADTDTAPAGDDVDVEAAAAAGDDVNQAAVAGDDAPERVIPGTNTIQAPVQKDGKKKSKHKKDKLAKSAPTDIAEVLKEYLAPLAEEIRKTQGLAGVVEALEERIEKFGKQPDDRNSAYLNGANGTAGLAPRDGNEADPHADLRKAAAEARTQADVIKSSKDLALTQIKDALTGSGTRHFENVTDRFTNL